MWNFEKPQSEDLPLFSEGRVFWHSAGVWFLRSTNRKKDGKDHRYFSIVENQRISATKTVQRTVLCLGELNDQQQASWRKTLAVFDEETHSYTNLKLFPDDRPLPEDAVDGIQVKLSGLELRRPRPFGNCWLASELWQQLGLTDFWRDRLGEGRESVGWEKVLRLLVVNRLLEPGSEFRVHRHWFMESAMDVLLEESFAVAEKDRLYRCLDRIVEHKQDLFVWLKQKWSELFHADFEVLLYDLTSTYFEGEMEENPKARRGYSRDSRPDCLQVVIALVVTPDGFPLAYEVMDGNTSEQKTLRLFLDHIEKTYGKARRVWVMDRKIPTEAMLAQMRQPDRQIAYLVGRRVIRAGAQRRTSGQGDGDAAETAGAVVAQTACDAAEPAVARPTAAADRRGEKRGGTRLRVREGTPALAQRRGYAPDVHVPSGPGETAEGATARWTLPAAQQPDGGRPGGVVGTLCAVDADRSGVPVAEDGSGNPANLPSAGKPGGCTHPGRVSGVLSPGNSEESLADPRAWFDADSSAGKAGHDPDDRCLDSDAGRALADVAALHATGSGGESAARANPTRLALTATAAHHGPCSSGHDCRRVGPTPVVVKTFR